MSQQFTEKGRLFGFPKGERHVHGQKRKSLNSSVQTVRRLASRATVSHSKSRTVALRAGRTKPSFETSKKYRVVQTFLHSSSRNGSGFWWRGQARWGC